MTFADMPTDSEGRFDIDGIVRDVPWDLMDWLRFSGVVGLILAVGLALPVIFLLIVRRWTFASASGRR